MSKNSSKKNRLTWGMGVMLLCGAFLVALPWLLRLTAVDKTGWDKPAITPLWKVKAFRYQVYGFAYSQHGNSLLSLGDGRISKWDPKTGKTVQPPKISIFRGNSLFSTTGRFVAVERSGRLASKRVARKLLDLSNSTSSIQRKIVVSVNEETFVGDGFDLYDILTGKHRFFSTSPKNGRALLHLPPYRNWVSNTFLFSPDERRVCAVTEYSILAQSNGQGDTRSEARMWDLQTGQLLAQKASTLGSFDEAANYNLYAFSSDGTHFYKASSPSRKDNTGSSGSLLLRDVFSGRTDEFLGYESEQFKRNIWTHPTFSPRGRYLACVYDSSQSGYSYGGQDGSVYLWDLKTHRLKWKVNIAGFKPRALAFSSDEKQLAAGGYNYDNNVSGYATKGKLVLLSSTTGNSIIEYSNESHNDRDAQEKLKRESKTQTPPRGTQFLPGDSGPATALTFSPDGTRLAAGYVSGEIKMWKVPQ